MEAWHPIGCSRQAIPLPLRRKAPIVAGMLLAMTMIACNYVNSGLAVMFLMSLAFFGKGFGAPGWTVISETSPKSFVGEWRAVQPDWQPGLHHHADYHRSRSSSIPGRSTMRFCRKRRLRLLTIITYLPIVGEIRRLESPRDLIAGDNA